MDHTYIGQKWPITINFGNNLLRNTVSELYSNVPLFRAYSGVFLKNFFISPITGSRGPIVAFLSPIVTFLGPIAAFSCKNFFISPHNRFKGPYSGVFGKKWYFPNYFRNSALLLNISKINANGPFWPVISTRTFGTLCTMQINTMDSLTSPCLAITKPKRIPIKII